MIPKVINYCWFGNKSKSTMAIKCIESWKKYMPDYKIIEWNEGNFDVNQNDYIREAYSKRKWAYVSDFARMKILYNNGGIYVDTDVEFIKKLPDSFLDLHTFSGIESGSFLISPGLIFGCAAGDKLVEEIIRSYETSKFINTKIENMETINIRVSNLLMRKGFVKEDKFQKIDKISIFPSKYFCAYDSDVRKTKIEAETISIHHYAGSWFSSSRRLKFLLGTLRRRINGVFFHHRR